MGWILRLSPKVVQEPSRRERQPTKGGVKKAKQIAEKPQDSFTEDKIIVRGGTTSTTRSSRVFRTLSKKKKILSYVPNKGKRPLSQTLKYSTWISYSIKSNKTALGKGGAWAEKREGNRAQGPLKN